MTTVHELFRKKNQTFLSIFSDVILHDLPTLSPCFQEAALLASPQSVCLLSTLSTRPFSMLLNFYTLPLTVKHSSNLKKVFFPNCLLSRKLYSSRDQDVQFSKIIRYNFAMTKKVLSTMTC